jgi:hypothetical protein
MHCRCCRDIVMDVLATDQVNNTRSLLNVHDLWFHACQVQVDAQG